MNLNFELEVLDAIAQDGRNYDIRLEYRFQQVRNLLDQNRINGEVR